MRFYTTILKRYLQYFYNEKDTIVSLNALYLATTYAKIFNHIFFKEQLNRQEIIEFNRKYRTYLHQEKQNPILIASMKVHTEINLPTIIRTLDRLDKFAADSGVEANFIYGKWRKCTIAVKVI